uniref:RNA helicase n=1 Tax=Mimivirus LCMiAC02 TaxID=2506609 RepID=A0A481Z1I3_9VIRU|nr:MAG: DEAD/DEAH box helicase [Mimivirus LCMiAC02]
MDNMDNIGILDPLGIHNNPLTDEPYSDTYKELGKLWSNFPVYKNKRQHIEDIKNNQVIIIISQTGSGKSVLFPKFALHALGYKGKKIVMTLPKQIITKSAAIFSSKTLDVKIGEHIGYKYRGSPRGARGKDPNILYTTDGTLVQMLLQDPKLLEVDVVLVDELHERKIQIDFLLYLLRETLKLRKNSSFRVILMSATIDTSLFENYYSDFKVKTISITGRTFPVESIFLDSPIKHNKFMEKGLETIIKILKKEKKETESSKNGDILFFITSKNETFTLCKNLSRYLETSEGILIKTQYNQYPYCVELFSGISQKKQELAQDKDLYKEQNNYNRKIVVSTNVAESSLTVDGIKYVIDSGLELHSEYDPSYHAKVLDTQLITHAQAKQRMGRAGRTKPGICYHLYTEDDMNNKMEKFPLPDIKISDISSESLKLLAVDSINDVEKLISVFLKFIEPPREKYIRSSINFLTQLGAIENNTISKLGKSMINIRMNEPMMSLALIYSKIYNCSYEMAKILNMIDVINNNLGALFYIPRPTRGRDRDRDKYRKEMEKFKKVKKKFRHKYGDHLSLLKIYEKFYNIRKKNRDKVDKVIKWCNDNYLKYNILSKAVKYVYKTNSQIRNVNINPDDIGVEFKKNIKNSHIDDRILACLFMAYKLNTAVLKLDGKTYRTRYSKDLNNIKLSKHSFLNLKKKMNKNVFYTELVISKGNPTLNITSIISNKLLQLIT